MTNHDKHSKLIESIKGKEQIKILFVCLGNICRSPAAEGVMKDIVEKNGDSEKFYIDSAGTGGWHVGELPDKRMRVHAFQRGYNLTHHCRQVRTSDFEDFDIIVAMDENNRRNLQRMAPTAEDEKKIVMMADFADPSLHYDHIPDPYYEGSEGFELVLDLLESACHNLYRDLRAIE